MASLHLVVMAGGSGTRFWPKSTAKKPKQLLSFAGDGSPTLLEQTLSRFDGIVPANQRWIVTTELLASPVHAQAPHARILAEPQGRNTAPCVYWAARAIAATDPEGVMLVMPSDHHIRDLPVFRAVVEKAAKLAASQEVLVTLGMKPARAETGYGYLQVGAENPATLGTGAVSVEKFVEKPNHAKAAEYVRGGKHLWNSGMFVWRASSILRAFDQYMPEMRKVWEAHAGDAVRAYPQLTATSIDYGIMEKAANVVTFPVDCGWNDLGSWTSLEELGLELGLERAGGVATAGDLIAVESSGCVVDAPGRIVALLGVKDLIIAQNGDAILVASKDRAQDIRQVVEAMKARRPDLI